MYHVHQPLPQRPLVIDVYKRQTLNGILERTDAYATGSGFLDAQSVNGITVIPLEDNLDNKMVYVRRKGINLSSCALKFVNVMFDYLDVYKRQTLHKAFTCFLKVG